MTADKAGIQFGSGEGRVSQYALEEGEVGLETADALLEHAEQTQARLLTVLAPVISLASIGSNGEMASP